MSGLPSVKRAVPTSQKHEETRMYWLCVVVSPLSALEMLVAEGQQRKSMVLPALENLQQRKNSVLFGKAAVVYCRARKWFEGFAFVVLFSAALVRCWPLEVLLMMFAA